jgi:hypothetical protein
MQRFPNCGARPSGGGTVGPVGGEQVDCMRDVFILNENGHKLS